MATHAPTARGRALATQDQQIASNVAQIEAAKLRPSAIDAMASRLSISPGNLKRTLLDTVFKGASDAEFMALVIVSQAYGLNPLTKEIFAFPAKGGGIIPVVSVDGWVRIMNEHPQFDGIEFNDIVDESGTLYAIEAVIYRRDRTRPIKVTEYMDECKGSGPAWQKTPKRMLRHRALIQGNRVAFGFSGIYAEGDEPEGGIVQQDGGELARNVTPPTRAAVAEQYDADTGEITEETARALDNEGFAAMEGRSDEQHGDQHDGSSQSAEYADEMIERAAKVRIIGDLPKVEEAFDGLRGEMTDQDTARVDAAIRDARARLKGGAK